MAYDWKSLIPNVAALGGKILGDKLAPDAATKNAQTNAQQVQFNQSEELRKSAQANSIRQSMMPGMYTTLGFSPAQGQQMAASYGNAAAGRPPVPAPSASGGLGSSIAKGVAGVGMSLAPQILSSVLKKGVPAVAGAGGAAGGLGGAIGALATNPITAVGAGALAAGLIWKKTQVHPTADTWTKGEQGPFDAHMKQLDSQGLPPAQVQQAKMDSARSYLNELVQFSQKGGKEQQVAKQAAATFREYYGDPMKYGIQLPF